MAVCGDQAAWHRLCPSRWTSVYYTSGVESHPEGVRQGIGYRPRSLLTCLGTSRACEGTHLHTTDMWRVPQGRSCAGRDNYNWLRGRRGFPAQAPHTLSGPVVSDPHPYLIIDSVVLRQMGWCVRGSGDSGTIGYIKFTLHYKYPACPVSRWPRCQASWRLLRCLLMVEGRVALLLRGAAQAQGGAAPLTLSTSKRSDTRPFWLHG